LTAELEARRLTGPHLLDDRQGAALDVPVTEGDDHLLDLWEAEARRLLTAVGWAGERTHVRRFEGGASLVLTAPIDTLYSATEVAEAAWAAANARFKDGRPDPGAAERLLEAIRKERRPHIRALEAEATRRNVTFLLDDDGVSVGTGVGALVFPLDAVPEVADVDWHRVDDVPLVLVTGSNGKTTTVRLVAAMAARAGLVAGLANTDGITVGGVLLEADDYSGPMGARRVLRHPTVQVAALETARGGILRRGLAVRRADVALVTNISEDHFGDWGVNSLAALADAKLVTTRVIPDDGAICLNADDPLLRERGARLGAQVCWYSLHPDAAELAQGRAASWLDGTTLMLRRGSDTNRLMDVASVPLTLEGRARYNISNALGAMLAAAVLRRDGKPLIPMGAMRAALEGVRGSIDDNPGRGNLLELAGVRIVIDYAHNPAGLEALVQLASAIPSERRLVVLGQAGDRTDDALRALARAALRLDPARIVLKEMGRHRRGREPGEVRRILAEELERVGAAADMVVSVDTEVEAAESALGWAREGDLLLLLTHEERDQVLDLLRGLKARRWRPGQDVMPASAAPAPS
jgi:UDP-N-acetylmuramyl tripeptide synthase